MAVPDLHTQTVNLLGPAGSGKGTQAAFLEQRNGFSFFSTGNQLKAEIAAQSALGRKIESTVRAGRLVPSESVQILLERFLKKLPVAANLVVDGFTRNLEQLRVFENAMQKAGRTPIHILIDIPEAESRKRLAQRTVCEGCGTSPSALNLKEADCTACGGNLVRRYDDENPKAVDQRVSLYKTEVLPVVELLSKSDKLFRVNGEQTREEVLKEILSIIGVDA